MLKNICITLLSILFASIVFANNSINLTELNEKYESSIVRIINGPSHGTGFLINDEGYIITNAHVTVLNQYCIDNENNIKKSMFIGTSANNYLPSKKRYCVVIQKIGEKCYAYRASIEFERADLDIAVLKVSSLKQKKPIPFATNLKKGERLATIGYSGANDNLQQKLDLFDYLGVPNFPPPEVVYKYVKEELKEYNISEKHINEIIQNAEKRYRGESLSEKQLAEVKLAHLAIAKLENHITLQGIIAMEKCPISKELHNEFLEFATPASGADGIVEKIVESDSWGLFNNAHVKMIQHNAGTRHGNSGGPMLNALGEVVGVVTIGGSQNGDIHLMGASHIDELKRLLDSKKIKYLSSTSPQRVLSASKQSTNAENEKSLENTVFDESSISNSVVRILSAYGLSMGTVVNDNGYVLTVFPDFMNINECYAITGNEKNFVLKKAKIINKDSTGLVLLKIDGLNINPIHFALGFNKPEKTRLVYFDKNDDIENKILKEIGFKGWSKIVVDKIKELTNKAESANNENKKHYLKEILSLRGEQIDTYLTKLPNTETFNNSISSDFFKLKNKLTSLKNSSQISSIIVDDDADISTIVLNEYNELIGINLGNKYADISTISNYLKLNNINNNALLRNNRSFSNKSSFIFLGDYLLIAFLIILAIIICLAIFYWSKKQTFFKRNLKNLSDLNIPNVYQEEEKYIPLKPQHYKTEIQKAKLSSIDKVVQQIQRLLSSKQRLTDINTYKLAKEYKEFQQVAITRLNKCLTLINVGNKEEAIRMAISYPSLLDILASLQFENLMEWIIYCRKTSSPTPEIIPNENIKTLDAIIEELKSKKSDNSAVLRKLIAENNFKDAIAILEHDFAIDPNNKQLEKQLFSLKNTLLEHEITEVSLLAQKEKHKEAIEKYDVLLETIPPLIQRNNTRWQKMEKYAYDMKSTWAKNSIKELYNQLKELSPEDWKSTVKYLSNISQITETYPELIGSIDSEFIAQRRKFAEEKQAEELNKIEFDNFCNTIYVLIDSVKEMFNTQIVSKDKILEKLVALESKWKKLYLFELQIPEDLSESVERCTRFLKNEIRAFETRRKRMIASISLVIISFVFAISTVKYINTLKRNAYAEYKNLYEKIAPADLLKSQLAELNEKNKKYQKIREFKEINLQISHKIKDEESLEKLRDIFISNSQKIDLSEILKEKSISVKNKEDEIVAKHKLLNEKLPKELKNEINFAYKKYEILFIQYKQANEHNIANKRSNLLQKLSSLKEKIDEEYKKGNRINSLMEDLNKLFDDFTATNDIYVGAPPEVDVNNFKSTIDDLKQKNDIIMQKETLKTKLVNSVDFVSLKKNIAEFEDFIRKHNILENEDFKKISKISLLLARYYDVAHTFYSINSPIARDLSANSSEILNNGIFDTIEKTNDATTIAVDFNDTFKKWLRNIYVYNYNIYGKDRNKPVSNLISTQRIYTISQAKSNPDSDFKWNKPTYAGMDVLNAESTIIKFTPLDLKNTKRNEYPQEKTFKIISLKCISDGTVMMLLSGEQLTNEQYLPESEFLNNIINRIYNENNNSLNHNTSFVKTIDDIIINPNININFKIYLIGSICEILKRDCPIYSGFIYSPTLQELNNLIQDKQNLKIVSPLSMMNSDSIVSEYINLLKQHNRAKITSQSLKSILSSIDANTYVEMANHNGILPYDKIIKYNKNTIKIYAIDSTGKIIEGKSISQSFRFKPYSPIIIKDTADFAIPTTALKSKLEEIIKNKYYISKEANSSFYTIMSIKNPTIDYLGCMNEQGEFAITNKTDDSVYIYIDENGKIVQKEAITKGAPFSPVIQMRKTKAYVTEKVLEHGGTIEMADTIYSYLYKKTK